MRFHVRKKQRVQSSNFEFLNSAKRIRKRLLWLGEVIIILILAAFSMQGINLVWDANTDVDLAGYVLYSGTNSRAYNAWKFIGNVTTNKLTGLLAGVNYFFAITAKNTSGIESDFSNEIFVRMPLSNHPPSISFIAPVSIAMGGSSEPIPFTIGDLEIPASNLFVSASCSNPSLVLSSGIKLSGSGSNRVVTIIPDTTKIGTAEISVFVSNGANTSTNTFLVDVGSGRAVVSDFWLSTGGLKLIWASKPWSLFRVFYKTNLSDLSWTQASVDLVSINNTTSWTDTRVKQSAARFYKVLQID